MAIDLRAFLKSVDANLFFETGGPPDDRKETTAEVTELDEEPAKVEESQADVQGFLDGIQNATNLCWRDWRVVQLQWVAAGLIDGKGNPLDLREELRLCVSTDDQWWADELEGDVDVVCVDGVNPEDLERNFWLNLSSRRDHLERDILARNLTGRSGYIMVDGSLKGRERNPKLGGISKTVNTKYLKDETELYRLKSGWRSRRFSIGGNGHEIYSCYVRLQSNEGRRWNFGLVRLEAFNLDELDEIAGLVIRDKQDKGSLDARWDRHISGVRQVETVLRSRRPPVFGG